LTPSTSACVDFPLFTPTIAIIGEHWIISPLELLCYPSAVAGLTILQVYALEYLFTLTLGAFGFYLLTKTFLSELSIISSKMRLVVASLSAIMFMSQPFYNSENLYWIGSAQLYAIVPWVLYLTWLALVSKSLGRFCAATFLAASLTSFAIVADPHGIVVIPITVVYVIPIAKFVGSKFGLLRAITVPTVVLSYSLVMALPSLYFLFYQHFYGTVSYWFGSSEATSSVQLWSNANTPYSTLLENNWFNRAEVIQSIASQDPGLATAIALLSVIVPAAALSTTIFAKGRLRAPSLFMSLIVVLTIFVYGAKSSFTILIQDVLGGSSVASLVLTEAYVPDAIMSISYGLLIALFLVSALERYPTDVPGAYVETVKLGRALKLLFWIATFGGHFTESTMVKTKPRYKNIAMIALATTGILLGSTMLSPVAYFVSPNSTQGIDVVWPYNESSTTAFQAASNFLNANPSGNVLWYPYPPSYGIGGNLIDRSFYYPEGSDGPFSSYYFEFMVGPGSDSLLSRGNWTMLAQAESSVGIHFMIIWGERSTALANEAIESQAFDNLKSFNGLVILENLDFHGLVDATTSAAAVCGGYSTYSLFSSLIHMTNSSQVSPIPFYTDVSPFPSGVLNGNLSTILVDNTSNCLYDLAMTSVDGSYLHSLLPFANTWDPSQFWSGGNTADANGFSWSYFVSSLPGYLWQNSYTIQDGYVYTTSTSANLTFSLNVQTSGNYEILVRTLESRIQPFSYRLHVGDSSFQVNTLETSSSGFVWIPLGTEFLKSGANSGFLESITGGALNVIAIVPISLWNAAIVAASNAYESHLVTIANPDLSSSTNIAIPTFLGGKPFGLLFAHGNYSDVVEASTWDAIHAIVKSRTRLTEASIPLLSQAYNLSNDSGFLLSNRLLSPEHFSFGVWFNWSGSLGDQVIAGQWGINNTFIWRLAIEPENGNLLVLSVGGGKWANVDGSPVIPHKWYFAAGVVSNGTVTLFINGQNAGEISHQFDLQSCNFTTVGFQPEVPGTQPQLFFNGVIAKLFTSTQALSTQQVEDVQSLGLSFSNNLTVSTSISLISNITESNGSVIEVLGIPSRVDLNSTSLPIGLLLDSGNNWQRENQSTPFSAVLIGSANPGTVGIKASNPNQGIALYIGNLASMMLSSLNVSNESLAILPGAENYPPGPVVARFNLQIPRHLNSTIYLSVSGFSTELILPGSTLTVGNVTQSPFPSFGVTEGFVITGLKGGGEVTLIIKWYQQMPEQLYNQVADTAFILGGALSVVATVIEGPFRNRWRAKHNSQSFTRI
jgi:hypothetical protein